jgi:hypothetical protein
LYYYTQVSRPSSQIGTKEPHSALWVKRNLNDKHGNKTSSTPAQRFPQVLILQESRN